jgi:cytochrome c oxidase accessory protein FixG
VTARQPISAFDEEHETFRNELASVAPDGRRRWVYARKPSGRYYRARTVLSWFLLAFLVLAPFVTFNGLPLVKLGFLERKFAFVGLLFWPQDFYLVVLLALTALLTLVLSTATVGRVWCGWLCPQTVFLEMLFRKIEFAIEGSAAQQLRRNRGPWTRERVGRTGLKLTVFFFLSFVIANVFLAYIIGADQLLRIVTDPPSQHLVGLFFMMLFSLVFFAVFARFREQACVLACPYGRVMSSLIDRHTITVTYDSGRGEPRGKIMSVASAGPIQRGDCIDCHQCVTVCPTAIDIRNGVQLECVNCTACIDACDDVMRRVKRPPGLIRLTSHEAVATGASRWFTGRVKAYAAVWLLLVSAVTTLIVRRPPLDVLVLRQPGTLFATLPNGDITNFYNLQVFNRTGTPVAFTIAVNTPAAARLTPLGPLDRVLAHGLLEGRLLLTIPADAMRGSATPVHLRVLAEGGESFDVVTNAVGPQRASRVGTSRAEGPRFAHSRADVTALVIEPLWLARRSR